MATVSGIIFAKEQALKGNLNTSNNAFVFSRTISRATDATFSTFSRVPLVNVLTKPFLPTTSFLVSASGLGIEGVSLVEDFIVLFEKITGEEVYKVGLYANDLELNLDTFYKKAGFLQVEVEQLSGVGGFLVKNIVGDLTLKSLRDRAYYTKDATSVLSTLLGEDRQKTYLVIIQDNTELRPTGGKINAFALITLSNGRIFNINTQSVYDADKFLTGYVDAPEPLKKHLGKDSWSLRESNWDPDFPTSAERAEWFLDKEIDKQVDGVIAVDLEFIKKLIGFTTPIRLNSLEDEISGDNLYSIVLENKSTSSNPRSNAVFFSELLSETLLKTTHLSEKEKPVFLGLMIEGLETKHLQIFLHNRKAQRAISELGWDGAVTDYKCDDNCLSDWLGIIESSFSDESSSLFLEKQAQLEITFEEGVVKKKLLLTLKYAPIESGSLGNYKSYVRVITPSVYGFSPAEILDASGSRKVVVDIEEVRGHKEAGVFVEIEPYKQQKLLFSWEGPSNLTFSEKGEYRFIWRKQAGTISESVGLTMNFPDGGSYVSDTNPSLTGQSVLGYNTVLSRDFVSRISW